MSNGHSHQFEKDEKQSLHTGKPMKNGFINLDNSYSQYKCKFRSLISTYQYAQSL